MWTPPHFLSPCRIQEFFLQQGQHAGSIKGRGTRQLSRPCVVANHLVSREANSRVVVDSSSDERTRFLLCVSSFSFFLYHGHVWASEPPPPCSVQYKPGPTNRQQSTWQLPTDRLALADQERRLPDVGGARPHGRPAR
jgi:hypothetical protein